MNLLEAMKSGRRFYNVVAPDVVFNVDPLGRVSDPTRQLAVTVEHLEADYRLVEDKRELTRDEVMEAVKMATERRWAGCLCRDQDTLRELRRRIARDSCKRLGFAEEQ